jgi:hypothetical protein
LGTGDPAPGSVSVWFWRKAALALYFMHYNFARIHKTLRVTPTMEAGVADHGWSLEGIARLAD